MPFVVTWQDSSSKTNYQRLSTDSLEEAKKIMRRRGVSPRACKFEGENEIKQVGNCNESEKTRVKTLMDAAVATKSNLQEEVSATIADAKANKIGKISLLLVAQLLFIGIIQLVSLAHSITPSKWEYRLETPSDYRFEDTMKDLGDEGWELVNARRATSKYKSGASYEMIFKKKKI